MRLTEAELAALPEKARRQPEIVGLYRQHDFMTAYALHTDARVREDYRTAIGAAGDWDKYGDLSLDMLKRHGMQPSDHLLDFGCGTGRLARKAVRYLQTGQYVGVDISSSALRQAKALAIAEGWVIESPLFWLPQEARGLFDFAWAFSVGIHLPPIELRRMFEYVRARLAPGGVFLCSYVPEERDERTGLKQFRCTLDTFLSCAREAGFSKFADVTDTWPGAQRIGRFET